MGLSHPANAQIQPLSPDAHHAEAYRLQEGEEMFLDGRMDEPFWDNVTPITNFTQQQPVEGAPPSERTEIHVAYDDENLYIGAFFYDSNPDEILAYQKRYDESLDTDDRFMWIIDTFNDGRTAFFFETNPVGLRGDGLLTTGQGTNLNKSWNGIWNVRTTINDRGWIAEVIIPFRTLDFDASNTEWGINFQRTIRRINEEILWSGWRRNQGLFRPQNAGKITGLYEMNQGLGLEITPYAIGNLNRTWDEDTANHKWAGDAGFDMSYNITPSMRTSLTINTDFAETEVDQRRVNLTRFPLYFPEQRDFFLEGANIFSFAPSSNIIPFFSRRIGLEEGNPIPIQVGAKVLGRERGTNFGLYQIRTGSTSRVNAEDFTVARIKQNIFQESTIGLIYTRRATLDQDQLNTRQTLGADLELSTSKFLGDKNLQFQAFFVWHNPHTDAETSSFLDRTSRGVRLAFPNFPFFGHVSYREFGSDFNPAVGFAERVAFRRLQPTIGYEWVMNKSSVIRSWETELYFEYLMDLDFSPETVVTTLTPVHLTFESGEFISASIKRNFERLHLDFDILRNGSILIPKGDYHNWSFNLRAGTAGYRKVSAAADFTREDFWAGHRNLYNLDLAVRPIQGINLMAHFSRSDVFLEQGDFQTDLIRFRANVDLTPDLAITNSIQFDNVGDILGLYNRFRWTLRPGADLYLVHTWNWQRYDQRFEPIETEGTIKLSFTHRF